MSSLISCWEGACLYPEKKISTVFQMNDSELRNNYLPFRISRFRTSCLKILSGIAKGFGGGSGSFEVVSACDMTDLRRKISIRRNGESKRRLLLQSLAQKADTIWARSSSNFEHGAGQLTGELHRESREGLTISVVIL
jgi:hypothetical protein